MTLYLSRLRLSRTPAARALDGLLNPEEAGRRMDAHHRLLWTVFGDGPDRRRDFLWRAEGAGTFLTLSSRPPVAGDLFEAPQVKDFAPALAPGDRLAFALRANATRTVTTAEPAPNGKPKRKHVDLVMDRLKPITGQRDLPEGRRSERPGHRPRIAQSVGEDWLARQGETGGFRPVSVEVTDYAVTALPGHRGARKGQPQFGIIEMSGVLAVTDPAAFLDRLAAGFGRARAFGCGLMLIRRAG